jgi:hypothetical protein
VTTGGRLADARGYSQAVRSNRLLRGLWIVAAGAGIALGAGHGVAAAESDSADGGAGPSSGQSAQTSQPSTGSKDADRGHDSADRPKDVDKPATTVRASTVAVDRDETATSAHVEQVKSAPAKSSKRAKAVAQPSAQVESTAPEAGRSVGVTPQKSAMPEVPKLVNEVTKPVVVPTAEVDAAATPALATQVVQDVAAIRSLAAPVAHAPPAGPLATMVIGLLSGLGLAPPAEAVAQAAVASTEAPAQVSAPSAGPVTGVKTGSSDLYIPVGSSGYTARADWYFPTQADGTVQAQGVIYLQHGFLGFKSWYSALATQLAQRTNSVVVVPNVAWIQLPWNCSGCSLSGAPMAQGVAGLFADPSRTRLTISANAAGYQGALPEDFVLTGHSAGGGLAAAAGGYYTAGVEGENHLKGVVMYDGVSSNGTFADALASLDTQGIPVYQIAAPPQSWNANGQTTNDLVALRPGQFVGDVLANGSHVDSLIGGVPIIDFISQLLIKRSPPGNTQAVYTLATGWINDMYAGRGPANPLYGIYGAPGQYIVMGQTAAVVLGPPPVVNVNEYGPTREFSSPNRV